MSGLLVLHVGKIFEFGTEPYTGLSNQEVADQVPKGLRLPKPENCSDDFYSIMISCWSESPADRPSFETLLSLLTKMMNFNYKSLYEIPELYKSSTSYYTVVPKLNPS